MFWFDKVLDWFQDKFQKDAQHRVSSFIKDGKGGLKANEHYFQLWLDEMFLKDERKWFSEWHPTVHSAVSLEFGDQKQVITRIAGASMLENVDDKHLNRVIAQTMKLTGLIPFRGGSVRINAALLAMKGQDSVKQLIDVLGEFSQKLAVPQLSAALDVAKPLAAGVSAIVGITDGEMMLGVDTTLDEESLEGGSFALVYATKGEVPPGDLSISDKRLRFRGADLTGYHYMLIRVVRFDARNDWDSLNAIMQPYQQAVDLLTDGQSDAGKKALKKAVGAALKSMDLTETDRRRVIDALKKRYADAEELVGSGAFSEDVDNSLGKLMETAISPAEAAALGPISQAEAEEGLE